MVTTVPPLVGPSAGLMPVTCGGFGALFAQAKSGAHTSAVATAAIIKHINMLRGSALDLFPGDIPFTGASPFILSFIYLFPLS
jgi:hypothetical protein